MAVGQNEADGEQKMFSQVDVEFRSCREMQRLILHCVSFLNYLTHLHFIIEASLDRHPSQ
jgi:hypothetical protein